MKKNTSKNLLSAAGRTALPALALAACALPAHAYEYPTFDRVMYVHECMRQHPGAHYEMVSKCSCVLDKLATQLKFEEFESMVTSTNAAGIGGERGSAIRDVDPVQKEVRRFRDLQAAAKKSCFINIDAK